MSKLKEMTLDELVNEATNSIMTGLIEGGGQSMKSKVHMWMVTAINWTEERKEKQEEYKPKRVRGRNVI